MTINSDKRIDQYQSLESVSGSDKILVLSTEGERTVTRLADKDTFLANIKTGNLVVEQYITPETGSSTEVEAGKIWFDTNYIYVAVSENTVKRVALSSF